jgi:hypothetical protein
MNTRSLILLQPASKLAWVGRPLRHALCRVPGFGYEWFIHNWRLAKRARLVRTKNWLTSRDLQFSDSYNLLLLLAVKPLIRTDSRL